MIASITVGQYDTAEHFAMRTTAYTEDVSYLMGKGQQSAYLNQEGPNNHFNGLWTK